MAVINPSNPSKSPEARDRARAFERIVPRSPLEGTLYHWVNLLCDVADQVSADSDLREAVQRMLELTCTLLDADRVVLILKEPQRPATITHEYRRSSAIPSILAMELTPSPLFDAIFGADRPIVLEDFDRARAQSVDIIREGKIKSTICAKLSFRGKPYGILSIQACSGERKWAAEDVALARLISSTFGLYFYAVRQSDAVSKLTASFLNDLTLFTDSTPSHTELTGVVREFQEQTVPADDERLAPHFPQLTLRERQILIRLDKKNKQIGRELMLSEATVKGHVGRLLAKLGVVSRQEAYSRVRDLFQGQEGL